MFEILVEEHHRCVVY